MASFFIHGETFNHEESVIFWQFASLATCVLIFVWYILIAHTFLAKFESPAETPNKSVLSCEIGVLCLGKFIEICHKLKRNSVISNHRKN